MGLVLPFRDLKFTINLFPVKARQTNFTEIKCTVLLDTFISTLFIQLFIFYTVTRKLIVTLTVDLVNVFS